MQDGGHEEFAASIEACRDRLRRIVSVRLHPLLKRRFSASDVVQETCVEALRRVGERGDDDAPLFLWLRFLARQKLLELERRHLGAQRRDARREARADVEAAGESGSLVLARVVLAESTSPESAAAAREDAERLRAALERMDERDSEVLVLRHFEQLSNAEVARVLGLSEAGASLRYTRAARRLAEALRSMGFAREGWSA